MFNTQQHQETENRVMRGSGSQDSQNHHWQGDRQTQELDGLIQEMDQEQIQLLEVELKDTKMGVVFTMEELSIEVEDVYYTLRELQADILYSCRAEGVQFMGNCFRTAGGEPPSML